MEERRDRSAQLMRRAAELARAENLKLKVVSAEYNFDGSRLKVSYSCDDRNRDHAVRLKHALEAESAGGIDMSLVGPRDEARALGGLGKCGRSLCCSSWLPFYPDVNMGMAKNQDLSLNPGKVTGLCGRLLCCLSYENEQYRQAKRILPRLGNTVNTTDGPGMVISLQVLKELVTIRLDGSSEVKTYSAAEVLGDAPQRRRADGEDSSPQADQRRRRRDRRLNQESDT
jgi:cell fate regulator YaaT (PSP1 superfamily)